jgi:hypothetical protein
MMRAPWSFDEVRAGEPCKVNAPSPDGQALGRELARLADVAEVATLKRFPDHLPRCNECAFKLGTFPNGCAPTVMDALKCVIENLPFYCHKGMGIDEQPTRLCSGWTYLVSESQS